MVGEFEPALREEIALLRERIAELEGHAELRTLRMVAQFIPDNVMLLDAQGCIRFINWTVPDLTVDAVIGTPPWDYLPPAFHARVKTCIEHVRETRRPSRYDVEYVADDGRVSRWESRVAPVLAGGRVEGFVVVSSSLTDREESQKMDALGRLASGVAHDFNNLLCVIQANIDVALRHELGPAEAAIEEIKRCGEQAAELTQRLLSFGRRGVVQSEALALNELTGDMLKMVRRLLPPEIDIQLLTDSDLPLIEADRGQLEQALLNLCINARDALTEGGRITVQTRQAMFAEEDERGRCGQYVVLRVSDDGEGMTPEVRARVFEPFFTTKAAGSGTGLGLALVYRVVQQHGGTIDVLSAAGQGTTFEIHLPISVAEETNGRRDVMNSDVGEITEGGRRRRVFE